jgi:hypothetical protein
MLRIRFRQTSTTTLEPTPRHAGANFSIMNKPGCLSRLLERH